jgi:hypothetical protein
MAFSLIWGMEDGSGSSRISLTQKTAYCPVYLAFRTIRDHLKTGVAGAGDRNRTCDLRVTSALLYRLSYTGGGLNLAPTFGSRNSRRPLNFQQAKKCPAAFATGHFLQR